MDSSKHNIWRSIYAFGWLIALMMGSTLLNAYASRTFGPRNVANTTELPFAITQILISLILICEFALYMISICAAAMLWLLLMKPFFAGSELRILLGLDFGKPTRSKTVVTRVFETIY
jgi:hypothetical protein